MSESRERRRNGHFAPTELSAEQCFTQELPPPYNRSCTPPQLPTFGYGTWEGCRPRVNELSFDSCGTLHEGLVKLTLTFVLMTCVLRLYVFTSAAQTLRTEVAAAGTADGKTAPTKEPALTGDRRPLYRLHKSDVVDIRFTFTPEYDQVLTVQPDGFMALKGARAVLAEGLTLPDLSAALRESYGFMRDPEISVTLKDFERPSFLAGGQLGRPGKYDLRSRTTVTEGIAIAGGFTEQAKHSQVVLFRRAFDGLFEAHVLNIKAMLSSRNLDEDLELKPGDMLYVPQNRISKIRKYLPASSLSTFFSPAQF